MFDEKTKKVGGLNIGVSSFKYPEDYIKEFKELIKVLGEFPEDVRIFSVTIQNNSESPNGIRVDIQASN